jgi:hypothetical protein
METENTEAASSSSSSPSASHKEPQWNLSPLSKTLINSHNLPHTKPHISLNLTIARTSASHSHLSVSHTNPSLALNEPLSITLSSHNIFNSKHMRKIKRKKEKYLQSVTAVVVKDAKKLASR